MRLIVLFLILKNLCVRFFILFRVFFLGGGLLGFKRTVAFCFLWVVYQGTGQQFVSVVFCVLLLGIRFF